MKLLPILKGVATYIPGFYGAERGSTGGSESARYCYAVWMRHLDLISSLGEPLRLDAVAELGPGDSLGSGIAALLSGANRLEALDIVKYAHSEKSLALASSLVELFTARARIPDDVEFPGVYPRLKDYRFPSAILTEERLRRSLAPERLASLRAAIATGTANEIIKYQVPWKPANASARRETLDFVFSQAVLEHVDDLADTHRSIADLLRVGGLVSHVVDLRSHKLTAGWDGHLEYGEMSWQLVRGRRPYLLNRRSPAAHLDAIAGAGLTVVHVERIMATPTLSATRLAREFRSWSDEDRCTTTMVVVARK